MTGNGQPFANWHAMTAVLLANRERSLPHYPLQMELAARMDPRTGKTRVALRELAEAVHHRHHRTTSNQLRDLVQGGYLERVGTGRPGRASEHNTETYRLRVAVTAPHDSMMSSRDGASRVAVTATGRGAVTATEKKRENKKAAKPAPSRDRSGSAAQEAGNGRVQVNDPSWRHLPERSTGMPEPVKAMVEQAKREAGLVPGTLHQLRGPDDPPPAHEGSTGTWG
jgi:hypothetical protein